MLARNLEAADRRIIRESKKIYIFLTETRVSEMAVRQTGILLSVSTMKRRCCGANFNGRIAINKRLVSNKNRPTIIRRARRIDFPWQNVLFSDESTHCGLSSDEFCESKICVRVKKTRVSQQKISFLKVLWTNFAVHVFLK